MDTTATSDLLANTDLRDNLSVVHLNENDVFCENRLNLLVLNINSIRNKIDDLHLYVSNFNKTIHFLCITETRVSENEAYLCDLPNYTAICCPRTNRSGGGACIFVHSSLDFDVLINEEFLEGSNIVVTLKEPKINVAVIYRPPHANLVDSISYLDMLLEKFENLICVGDFNINLLSPDSEDYKTMLTSNGFCLLNKIDINNYTFKRETSFSILDHALTDLYNRNFRMSVHDVSFSDHRSLLISSSARIQARNFEEVNIIKHDYNSINSNLAQSIENVNNLDDLTETLKSLISQNVHHIKMKRKRKESLPWVNATVLEHINIRDQMYKRTLEWPSNSLIMKNYKQQKNFVNNLMKSARKNYYCDLIASNRNDIRKVWSIMNEIVFNKKNNVNCNQTVELEVNGNKITNITQICNAFNNFFIKTPVDLKKELSDRFNNQIQVPTLNRSNEHTLMLFPATENEISNFVRELNISSAPGIDKIPAKLLKVNVQNIVPKLTLLINQSSLEGKFPDSLKTAKVRPIFKSGSKKSLGNYRPISVLPTLSKPFEKYLHSRIYSFFKKHKIIHKNQFGFQPKSNTLTAAISFVNDLQTELDKKSMICASIFIDVSKAFDCVPHDLLLSKLYKYGIRGNAHRLIESYLDNRKQKVVLDGAESIELIQKYGVPQGSIIGPLFFIVFVNDLFHLNLKGRIQLYADDAAIIYNSKNLDTLFSDMQQDLNLINTWFFNNGLTINASKTKYVIFSYTDKFNNINNQLFIGNEKLERVRSTVYLGLTIQQNLKWSEHVEKIYKKITNFLGMLRRSSYMLPIKERKSVFYAHVQSQISYLNVIWQNSAENILSKISIALNKFMRVIFWEDYTNPNIRTVNLYSKNNMLNLKQINFYEAIVFMYKLKHNLIRNNIEIEYNSDVHSYNTRSANDIRPSIPRTNYLRLGCMYSSIVSFNNLPITLKDVTPLSKFKEQLKQYILNAT